MKTYVVVYKSPDGQIRDRYVTARNHRKAMELVSRENLEVVSVDRAENEESLHLVGNPRNGWGQTPRNARFTRLYAISTL